MDYSRGKGGRPGPTPTGESYHGVVSRIGAKFGFIDSQPVKEKYGCDVFAPAAGLRSMGVGDTVQFEVMTNDKGQPQAASIRLLVRAGSSRQADGPGPRYGYGPPDRGYGGPERGKGGYGGPERGKGGPARGYPGEARGYHGEPRGYHGEPRGYPGEPRGYGGEPRGFGGEPRGHGGPERHGGHERYGGPDRPPFDGRPRISMPALGWRSAQANGETFFGTISSINTRFGFIECRGAEAKYGGDVFATRDQLSGFRVGDRVEFNVTLAAPGRPQADNLRFFQPRGGPKGGGKAPPPPRALDPASSFIGVFSSAGSRFGFIECRPIMAKYGMDVFAPATALRDFKVGETLEFEVTINSKKQPQATNIVAYRGRPLPPSGRSMAERRAAAGRPPDDGGRPVARGRFMAEAGGPPGSWPMGRKREREPTETGEEYVGRITSLKGKFGFIECSEIKATYSNDVFCPAAMLHPQNVGDWVLFELLLNDKGQPQAKNVRPASGPQEKRRRAEGSAEEEEELVDEEEEPLEEAEAGEGQQEEPVWEEPAGEEPAWEEQPGEEQPGEQAGEMPGEEPTWEEQPPQEEQGQAQWQEGNEWQGQAGEQEAQGAAGQPPEWPAEGQGRWPAEQAEAWPAEGQMESQDQQPEGPAQA